MSTRIARGRGLALAAGIWLAACTPSAAEDEFWRPWYDEADAAEPPEPRPDLAGKPDAPPPGDLGKNPDLGGMPGSCSLAVTVTTVSAGGRYSPRNIGAIWINDSGDRFIKTLAVWADRRAKYLKRWNDATTAAKLPGNRVDAISSATKSSHGVRTGNWNCANTAAMPMPDGAYKVCFELTDFDGTGPYDCVAFTKGPAPVTLTPPNVTSFTARRLELTP